MCVCEGFVYLLSEFLAEGRGGVLRFGGCDGVRSWGLVGLVKEGEVVVQVVAVGMLGCGERGGAVVLCKMRFG